MIYMGYTGDPLHEMACNLGWVQIRKPKLEGYDRTYFKVYKKEPSIFLIICNGASEYYSRAKAEEAFYRIEEDNDIPHSQVLRVFMPEYGLSKTMKKEFRDSPNMICVNPYDGSFGRTKNPEGTIWVDYEAFCRELQCRMTASKYIDDGYEFKQLPHRAVLTYLLIAINILIYIQTQGKDTYTLTFALSQRTLTFMGLYRMFTTMFLHGNTVHLVGNVISLLLAGTVLEKAIGSKWFGIFYLGGGAIAGVTSLFFYDKDMFILGSSGAIMVLLGAGIIYGMTRNGMTRWIMMLGAALIACFILGRNVSAGAGVLPAHLVGFATGIIGMTLLSPVIHGEEKEKQDHVLREYQRAKERHYI